MTAFLLHLALAFRIAALQPGIEDPLAHVRTASAHAGGEVSLEVMLAIAYLESRYQGRAVSRMEAGRRVGGVWSSTLPAGTGPRYCGVMQAAAGNDWARCVELRELDWGYRAGVEILRRWLVVTRGDLRGALDGYACGFAGVRRGCGGYGARVLRLARRLRSMEGTS